jgi:fatty acid desaturase
VTPVLVIAALPADAEGASMRIGKLDALKTWQLTLAMVGLGVVIALAVWGSVWVLWTVRPLLAAGAALAAVGRTLYALHRHRRSRDWSGSEWIGS